MRSCPISIAKSGEAQAEIVWFSSDEDQVTRFAAEELSSYLERCSGVRVNVRRDRTAQQHAGSGIAIMPLQHLKQPNERNELPSDLFREIRRWQASAKDDSLMICARGEHIILTGQNNRGVLYAAYRFLELLGVQFIAPDFAFYQGNSEWIPQLEEISIDPGMLPIIEEPDFKYRRKYVEEGWSHTPVNLIQLIAWMAKKRLNTLVCPMNYQGVNVTQWDSWREALIPHLAVTGMMVEVGGHGFESFLPPEVYREHHPEWFPNPEDPAVGLRADNPNVFHFTNREALDTYIRNVIAYLKERPEIAIFDAWPPDHCAWPAEDVAVFNSIANANAYIINELSRRLQAELPHVVVESISYTPATDPPEPEYMYNPNTIVDFALYDRSYKDAIYADTNNVNRFYSRLFDSWRRNGFSGTICVYEYYTKYSWHSLPVHLPQLIFEEIPYYHRLGVEGLGIYSEPANWLTYELTHMLVADLSWNCKLNKQYLDRYFDIRFGQAAEVMKIYYDQTERAGRLIFDRPEGTYDDPNTVAQAIEHYRKAKDHVKQALDILEHDPDRKIIAEGLYLNTEYALEITRMQLMKLEGQEEEVRQRIKMLVERQRFRGTLLESMYLIRKYDDALPRGKKGILALRHIFDMYRKEWGMPLQ
jgi:hypothetical protein